MRIEFKAETEVSGSVLRLGDVARISPGQAAKRYKDISLFGLSRHQTVRTYRASTLRAYVQQKIDPGSSITWAGHKRITVRRAGVLIDRQTMQEVVDDYLQDQFNHPSVSQVSFLPGALPGPFVVQSQDWTCTVRPSDDNVLAARRFALIFRHQGRVVRNVTAQGQVKVRAKVAVTARHIGQGTTLTRDDVTMQTRELSRLDHPVFELQNVLGKRVRYSLGSGAVIDEQDVARPHLVQRNTPVTLIARKSGMQIVASGIAKEDGAKMDRVRVENSRSGQEVYGRVVARDTIEVLF